MAQSEQSSPIARVQMIMRHFYFGRRPRLRWSSLSHVVCSATTSLSALKIPWEERLLETTIIDGGGSEPTQQLSCK
jgi:hypothetical protein